MNTINTEDEILKPQTLIKQTHLCHYKCHIKSHLITVLVYYWLEPRTI